MSQVTHMDESCHTYGWVMSHIWMSHVTHMDESCHTYRWVKSHIWMSHVTRIDESCHIYGWVMSHIWMSCVTYRRWQTTRDSIINFKTLKRFVARWSELQHRNLSCNTHLDLSCNARQHLSCNTHYDFSCNKLHRRRVRHEWNICGSNGVVLLQRGVVAAWCYCSVVLLQLKSHITGVVAAQITHHMRFIRL